jgi:hypothetical protein
MSTGICILLYVFGNWIISSEVSWYDDTISPSTELQRYVSSPFKVFTVIDIEVPVTSN